ncbi:unnamed protein product [Symbiodinium natans]|uniref:Uncharacterized protein n=1 Tax=Symbiodinium natans TaxID=878477 RepID=A0A812T8U2_9DINO|nr:unnamed protein product [Symbiodinium natans]
MASPDEPSSEAASSAASAAAESEGGGARRSVASWASKLGQKASQLKSVTKEAVQTTREAIANEAKLVARDMADLKDGVREGVRLTVQDTSSLRERLGRDTDALRKAFAPPKREATAQDASGDQSGEGPEAASSSEGPAASAGHEDKKNLTDTTRELLGKVGGFFHRPEEAPDRQHQLKEKVEDRLAWGTGLELPDWCQEKLPGIYSFVEVPGVGPLPEGSEEIEAKMFGHVVMLALKRFHQRSKRTYLKGLRGLGVVFDDIRGFLFSMFKEDDFYEGFAGMKLPHQQDLPKWRELHWKTKAELDQLKEASKAFVALDAFLRPGSRRNAVRCYSRWETHDAGGKTVRHRVYGVRLHHSAVEFDKVLGLWLEPEGILDRQATGALSATWSGYYIRCRQTYSGYYVRCRRNNREDGNDLRREAPVEEVAARFETWSHLLAASQMDRPDAAWLKPHVKEAMATMTAGLEKETTLLAATAYNPTQKTRDEACMMILRRAVKAMLGASLHLPSLRDQAFEKVLWMASNRNDAVRAGGLQLLAELFPAEERTTQLMEMSGADWPHMHAMSEVVASAGKGPSPVPASISSEVPTGLPSPRRLVEQSLLANPFNLPRERPESAGADNRSKYLPPEDDVEDDGIHVLFDHTNPEDD